jgi:hypothetical protein
MSAPPNSLSGYLAGHNDDDPTTTAAIVRWSPSPRHDSLHILLKGCPASLRGHFEIGHSNFQPEWR